MADERTVIDTHVLISGLFSTTSAPARALERAVAEGQLVAASDTLGELTAKLLSPTFDQYVSLEARYALLQRLVAVVDVVDVIQRVRASRDPKDDKFLEAGTNGRAVLIVTGDRDLLSLHPFRGIDILTVAQYLRRASGR